tara:strand:- start:4138 stop:4443 length:306 start_codon:yes stop_codon:yes gene_type:complete
LTAFPPAGLEHGFPGFDGVVAKHPSDDGLTLTRHCARFDFHPLGVCSGHVIAEAADLPLLVIHQPPDTVLRCMAINKWVVLVRHMATMAEQKMMLEAKQAL